MIPCKKLITLIGLAGALCVPFTAKADLTTYVRGSGAYFIPETNDVDNEYGAMVAMGINIESSMGSRVDSLELEVGYVKWTSTTVDASSGTALTTNASLKSMPVLLTYRYNTQLAKGLILGVGASVGSTSMKFDASVNNTITTDIIKDDDWVFTYGVNAQIEYWLTDNIAISAGYRYLLNEDATVSANSYTFTFEDTDVQVVEVGISIGWPR